MSIARAIAGVLNAELVKPWAVGDELLEYDVIGFGSGIYWWRHHWHFSNSRTVFQE